MVIFSEKLLTSISILLLLITGCANSFITNQANSKIPNWFLNINKSSTKYYGTAEGISLEEAINTALNSISKQISVTINSSMEVNKVGVTMTTADSKDEIYVKNLKSNIKIKLKDIKIEGYNVDKKKYINGKYYVLVSIDKKLLFNNIKSDLDRVDKKIENELSILANEDLIIKLKNRNRIIKLMEKAKSILLILKSIDNSFDDIAYRDRYNSIEKDLYSLNHKISFRIKTDKFSKKYINIIKKYLSFENINITPNAKYTLLINSIDKKFDIMTTNSRLKNMKFIKIVITFTIKSSGKIVSTNKIHIVNNSPISYEIARKKLDNFEKKIKEKGILNILIGR